MADIHLRGHLVGNDDATILRWLGWRDLTCPLDIQRALEEANGESVTVLVNSPGGSVLVGTEIYSILRRYAGETTALVQGMSASASTVAMMGCKRIVAEPGALLCYHNPSADGGGTADDHRSTAVSLDNVKESILNVYMTRTGKTRDEISQLMDQDLLISPQQALEYGFIDAVEGLPELEPEPVRFVAASGGYPHVTAQQRKAYQDYLAERAAQNERQNKADGILARARALAAY